MPQSPLESRLRYEFRNAELLRQALTHRSHSATHNERLEFLGDSVLNCAVAALLFQRFGKLDEGDLSRVRANLVKQQSLYEIAQALNIADGLRLGEGELRSGGFRRPSILADALEAIFGAIFLDSGFDAAQTVIKRLYVPILDHIDPRTLGKDAKTLLQEYLQGHKIALPTYTVVATHGAAHNQQFEVECTVPKLDVKVSGSGASRRAAEQAAAKKALDEVMAAAPALVAKPRRSKGARAPKTEPEVVPGVTGVQGALDLRAPERRERAAARTAAQGAAAGEGAERAAAAQGAPLAVIRAAHVQERPAEKDKPASSDGVPSAGAIGHRSGAAKTESAHRPVERVQNAAPAAEARPTLRVREATATSASDAPAPAESATDADPEAHAEIAAAIPVRAADAGH
ncbi:ribonuclease III [Paraburkholderia unamae]|uniref:ribonuclease III n=1 Tax=Paraburkholderia unamae TaxID=219649 RepID=UPI000DD3F28C|nr:ribonuclease III [Paraburkholderia unamae]